jgi:hypothetical protein
MTIFLIVILTRAAVKSLNEKKEKLFLFEIYFAQSDHGVNSFQFSVSSAPPARKALLTTFLFYYLILLAP